MNVFARASRGGGRVSALIEKILALARPALLGAGVRAFERARRDDRFSAGAVEAHGARPPTFEARGPKASPTVTRQRFRALGGGWGRAPRSEDHGGAPRSRRAYERDGDLQDYVSKRFYRWGPAA